jgi:hypothetical protein
LFWLGPGRDRRGLWDVVDARNVFYRWDEDVMAQRVKDGVVQVVWGDTVGRYASAVSA